MPTRADAIRREHVEAYVEDQLARWKPATANNRYRALQQLFRSLVDEGEIAGSPMSRMRPPKVPEDHASGPERGGAPSPACGL